MAQNLYRPYLTPEEISYLVKLLRTQAKLTEQVSLLKKLLKFQFSISTGIVSPAHTSTKISVEESLGLSKSGDSSRFQAHKKFSEYPELCTPEEILDAKTYRYENDLMTSDEEAEFEKEISK